MLSQHESSGQVEILPAAWAMETTFNPESPADVYERHLLNGIALNGPPKPLYQMWEIVKVRHGKGGKYIQQGRVVGQLFARSAYALESGYQPGWAIAIECDESGSIEWFYATDIIGRVDTADAA